MIFITEQLFFDSQIRHFEFNEVSRTFTFTFRSWSSCHEQKHRTKYPQSAKTIHTKKIIFTIFFQNLDYEQINSKMGCQSNIYFGHEFVVFLHTLTVERSPEHSSARTTPPSTMRHRKMAKYPNIPRVRACAMLQNQ